MTKAFAAEPKYYSDGEFRGTLYRETGTCKPVGILAHTLGEYGESTGIFAYCESPCPGEVMDEVEHEVDFSKCVDDTVRAIQKNEQIENELYTTRFNKFVINKMDSKVVLVLTGNDAIHPVDYDDPVVIILTAIEKFAATTLF